MKLCRTCKQEKDLSGFSASKRSVVQAKCKACDKDYRDKNKNKVKDYQLRHKYGISLAEYETLYEQQEGRCAICSGTCATGRLLAVDHCHSTHTVRALLCVNCNQGLGSFKDNLSLLQKAIEYLKKYA